MDKRQTTAENSHTRPALSRRGLATALSDQAGQRPASRAVRTRASAAMGPSTPMSASHRVDAKVWGSWSQLGPFSGPTTMLSPQSLSGLTLARPVLLSMSVIGPACSPLGLVRNGLPVPLKTRPQPWPAHAARPHHRLPTLIRAVVATPARLHPSVQACYGVVQAKRWSTLLNTRPQKGHSLEHAA